MRQVIAHEIGHALGLAAQHGGVVSSFPVDSLRAPELHEQIRRERDDHGLRAPELRRPAGRRPAAEGLHPPASDPFDDFAINWGYRVHPRSRNRADDERADAQQLARQSERDVSVSLRARRSSAASIPGRRPKTSATIRYAPRTSRSRTCERSCRSSSRGRRGQGRL